MENKKVGWLILGIAVLMVVIIFLFQSALKDIVSASCTIAHGGNSCPMYDTINQQTYLSLAIVGVLVILALFLMFTKPKEKIVVKTIKEKAKIKEYNLSDLNKEEKSVFNLVKESKAIFQAELIEKVGLGKAKVTRILDRLEGNQLVERKRRGLNNVVILKE